jgi:DNA-cytosine methyltransferase
MIYGSICSGIEAATVAWEPLGFRPAWFAEIDPFCSALLAHHYPGVQNLGDFTRIETGAGPIDMLAGGTPCQSFSVAGRRGGLEDARGNLAIEFCRLAGRLRPRWIVWENVPGVLSSNGGRDFGAILGALADLGYGCAWRVLDAQFFGVPQRRRRVFVVGHLGDWRRAAAVLLELLRKEIKGNTTDVPPIAGSAAEQLILGWSKGQDPPELPFEFRLKRALRVEPIDQASIDKALVQFDEVVAKIETCRGRELGNGKIVSTWDKNDSDDSTCAACDSRTFCPQFKKETAPRLPAIRPKNVAPVKSAKLDIRLTQPAATDSDFGWAARTIDS